MINMCFFSKLFVGVCVKHILLLLLIFCFFFFNDTATTEIYTLSLHDALPIFHTHFDAGGADLNLQPDHHALPNGVTTAVDAGGSGHRNFEAFKSRTIHHSKTRILAWLNIVGAGMYGPEVENDVAQMNAAACAAMVKKYPDLIVGIKTAHFQPTTWDAVDRAVDAGKLSSKPVMVDFAQKPERTYPDLVLKHLRPGDIHTHFYGSANPLLDENKKIAPYALAARERGV